MLRCCCVSHEDRYQQLLEFVRAEGLQLEEVEDEVEDLLEVFEGVAAEVVVFLEKESDLCWRSPNCIALPAEHENVVPGHLYQHLWVMN